MPVEKIPKVSVCVITYNHEKYIRQCLQSILDQETDFDFEVIVGDDCSTDDTRLIIQEFVENYPGVVKPVYQEVNTGGSDNYLDVHEAASGEYVAHIDGDDYALPGKLQAQADCLDTHQDVSMSVHALRIHGTNRVMGDSDCYPTKGSISDLLRMGTYFGHSSVMYRKKYKFAHSMGTDLVDYYYHIELASKGSIYLDRTAFGAYRYHEQSITKDPHRRGLIEQCYEAAFDRALELGVSYELVSSSRLNRRMSFALSSYLSGDIDGFKKKIQLSKEDIRFASKKHRALHYIRRMPELLGFAIYVKRLLTK